MRNRLLVDNQMNISLEIQMPYVCHFIIQSEWNKKHKKWIGGKDQFEPTRIFSYYDTPQSILQGSYGIYLIPFLEREREGLLIQK